MVASGDLAEAMVTFNETLFVFGGFKTGWLEADCKLSRQSKNMSAVPALLPRYSRDDLGYNKAFVIVGREGPVTHYCDVALGLAVLHYNVATTLRLQDLRGDPQRVLDHYNQCLRILTPLSSVQYSSCFARLAVACLVNTAVIFFDSGAFENSTIAIYKAHQMAETMLQDPGFEADYEAIQGINFLAYLIPYSSNHAHACPAA